MMQFIYVTLDKIVKTIISKSLTNIVLYYRQMYSAKLLIFMKSLAMWTASLR